MSIPNEQDDLVTRLREYYSEGEHLFEEKHPICDEAADEIERLRQEIANLTQSGDKTSKQAENDWTIGERTRDIPARSLSWFKTY